MRGHPSVLHEQLHEDIHEELTAEDSERRSVLCIEKCREVSANMQPFTFKGPCGPHTESAH